MPIFHIIVLAHFVDKDGLPAIRAQSKQCMDPTITKMLLERAEVLIEIGFPAECADDSIHLDILDPGKVFILILDQACVGKLFGTIVSVQDFCNPRSSKRADGSILFSFLLR